MKLNFMNFRVEGRVPTFINRGKKYVRLMKE